MSFGATLVAIAAIVAFTIMRVARYRAGFDDPARRHGRHGLIESGPSPRETELQKQVEDLRQRVAVLERLATEDDRGRAIAAEIEALREPR